MKKYYAVFLIVIVILVGFAYQCPAEEVLNNPAIDESNTAVILDAIERMGVLAIDTVKDVSPHVWKMARAKAIADAVGRIIWSICWAVAAFVLIIFGKKLFNIGTEREELSEPQFILPLMAIGTATLIAIMVSIVDGTTGIKTLVALDYHTLMSIAQLLR